MVARPTRKRMYRTMQGRMVDIEKLRATNEGVRAIGNMSVNARGDVLGQGGQIVKPKEAVMREYYEQPKGRASDTPIRRVARTPQRQPIPKAAVVQSQTINPQPQPRTTPKPKVEKKGIDAALDGIE